MPGGCVFNDKWCVNPDYKNWLLRVPDDNKSAGCLYCNKNFKIFAMGESALKSHMTGKKHVEKAGLYVKVKKQRLLNLEPSSSNSTPASSSASAEVSQNVSIAIPDANLLNDFLASESVMDAEIIWTLKTVKNYYSYKSNEDVRAIFRRMFPDSKIAASFTCGEQKTKYMVVFGIYPYLKTKLADQINTQSLFVLCFDETFNKKLKKKQMDVHVRFWSNNIVVTRYVNSVFMGHGTAIDLLKHFLAAIISLHLQNTLQISMDGPSVNWKFFSQFKDKLDVDFNTKLINIGSCGIHVSHNSFKSGSKASNFEVDAYLSALYYLFEGSPARREDFEIATGSDVLVQFPLKFVDHRWLESIPAAERALELTKALKAYLKGVQSKKFKKPECMSWSTVELHLKDPLLDVKITIFISVAKILHSFLLNYQTDKPMVFFLSEDLASIIKQLMKRFVKKEILNKADITSKLIDIQYQVADNCKPQHTVGLGYEADELLKSRKKSEKDEFNLRVGALNFYKGVIDKLLEKSPINYSLVRNLSCLDPRSMVSISSTSKKIHSRQESCKNKFKVVLTSLKTAGIVRAGDVDSILNEFDLFYQNVVLEEATVFINFNPYKKKSRVDEFYERLLNKDPYQRLWKVVRMLLLLSHGQASVERGFSINKKLEVENLQEESIIAQRYVHEFLAQLENLADIVITKELRTSVSKARSRYSDYLETEAKLRKLTAKKKEEAEKATSLRQQEKNLTEEIQSLENGANELAMQAEKDRDFSKIVKSNSFRSTAQSKKEELAVVQKKILDLSNEL